METKEKKGKGKNGGNKESVKDRMNRWVAKSPKLEKFVDNTSYYFKHPDKFSDKVNEIYTQATGKGETTLTEISHKLKAAFRMVRSTLKGEYTGTSKMKVYLWGLGLIYVVSPIDLFPDFLPVIGFVDDAALLIWLIKTTNEEVEKFEQWEAASGINTINPAY